MARRHKPIISAVASDITVVDTSNYMPVSGEPGRYGANPVAAIDNGQPETAWLHEQWGRPVIRAWTAPSAHMLKEKGKAHGEPGRLAIPVSGDSAEAKQLVMRLVEDSGFDAVDAGAIAESWRQQFGPPPTPPNSPPTSSAMPSRSPTAKPGALASRRQRS